MRRNLLRGAVTMALMAATGHAWADESLEEGDLAPPFTLAGSDGQTYQLTDLRGQVVVLAWYPRAFTGG